MKVVLDTGIIHKDYRLRNASLDELCKASAKTGDEIYLPQVVYDEFVNQYREDTLDKVASLNSSLKELNRLTDGSLNSPIADDDAFVTSEIDKYRKYLDSRLQTLGIKKIPIPKIPHEQILSWDLQRKKPFDKSGKGYRDYLIWESAKSIMSKEAQDLYDTPKAVFVTKNKNDFGDTSNTPITTHPDLIQNLQQDGYSPNSIQVIEGLKNYLDQYVTPKCVQLQAICTSLNNNPFRGSIDFDSSIKHLVHQHLEGRGLDWLDDDYCGDRMFENPTICFVNDIDFEVTDVRQISDGHVVVEANAKAECEVDYYIYKGDLCLLDEDKHLNITDWDWNDHYCAASDTAEIESRIIFILDSAFTEILSDQMEIESIKFGVE